MLHFVCSLLGRNFGPTTDTFHGVNHRTPPGTHHGRGKSCRHLPGISTHSKKRIGMVARDGGPTVGCTGSSPAVPTTDRISVGTGSRVGGPTPGEPTEVIGNATMGARRPPEPRPGSLHAETPIRSRRCRIGSVTRVYRRLGYIGGEPSGVTGTTWNRVKISGDRPYRAVHHSGGVGR